MALAQNIQALRRGAALSQEELAQHLGVSRQSVSKWESGASTPELDKLVQMAALFGSPLDALVGDLPGNAGGALPPPEGGDGAPRPPKGRSAARRVAFAIAGALLFFVLGCGAARLGVFFEAQPSGANALSTLDPKELRGAVFDLAIEQRLDYVPFFEEGQAPQEASEYLFYTFVLKLDEWGADKGRMTQEYVESVIRAHFTRYNVTHGPLFKAWDYEDGVYTALPAGIKEAPICALRDCRFFWEDGRALVDMTLDFCSLEGIIPDEQTMAQLRDSIVAGDLSLLTVLGSERFLIALEEDGSLRYLAHESVPA